ncbi:MAG: mandelate racemase/muconate lactonizing enzyme family protein, partial [Nitrospinota bacterium]
GKMKVASIEVVPVDMPLKGYFKSGTRKRNVQPGLIARVESDDGAEGVGDVEPTEGYSPAGRDACALAIRRKLAPALRGLEAGNILAALARMDEVLEGHWEAKAAVEMALFDLRGTVLGVPVWGLLGGRRREEVGLNAWVGIQPAERAAAEALDFLERGFRSCKVKVGGEFEADRDRVMAVREAVGDRMAIRADANETYDVGGAIQLARALASCDLTLFEQPVPRADLEGLAQVRRASPVPIMADEAVSDHGSLIRVLRAEAADIVKVKVMKQGGLLRTSQMVATAEAAGVPCVVGHGFGLTLHTLAEVHLAATSANVLDALECVGPLKMAGDVVGEPLDLSGGSVRVPDAPGLGAELDGEKLEAYRVRGNP